jgi:hypothetical protein
MTQQDRRRELARDWLSGTGVDLDDLLAQAMALESASRSDRGASGDEVGEVQDDLLLALSVATDDDPSGPWNHAGYHARRGDYSREAGVDFVRAAEFLRRAIDSGSTDELDSEEWRTTALASACRCFLSSHRPLAAAAILARMNDGEEARELREDVEAWLRGNPNR